MKERPIIFNARMVRAILNGRKMMTRRVVKLPHNAVHDSVTGRPMGIKGGEEVDAPCPYGQPGDRLWVREAFRDARGAIAGRVLYRASGDVACGWTPSIHMPRALSRITLEIVGVRVERVQSISGTDAMREGIAVPAHLPLDGADLDYALREFRHLWDSINAKRGFGWAENPWVWVIEFRRMAQGGAA